MDFWQNEKCPKLPSELENYMLWETVGSVTNTSLSFKAHDIKKWKNRFFPWSKKDFDSSYLTSGVT